MRTGLHYSDFSKISARCITIRIFAIVLFPFSTDWMFLVSRNITVPLDMKVLYNKIESVRVIPWFTHHRFFCKLEYSIYVDNH
jgi:hypothetical protein